MYGLEAELLGINRLVVKSEGALAQGVLERVEEGANKCEHDPEEDEPTLARRAAFGAALAVECG